VTSAAIGYTGTIWLNRAVAATPTEARMKSMLVAILVALAAPPAWAASAPPIVRKTPNLAKDAEAFPTLVGATTAIARINRALQAANAEQLDEMKDCLRDAPQDGYWWEQDVETPLLGARFVSFWTHGNDSCGGAHPNFISEALVFDLRTGERVDWKTLLPAELRGKPGRALDGTPLPPDEIASPAATALFIAESEKEGVGADCKEAFAEQEMHFELWPDAKAKGLAMRAANLLHWAEGPCSGPATIPLATLKQLGVNPALIQDIETGSYQVQNY
jgi:hypothetical protein